MPISKRIPLTCAAAFAAVLAFGSLPVVAEDATDAPPAVTIEPDTPAAAPAEQAPAAEAPAAETPAAEAPAADAPAAAESPAAAEAPAQDTVAVNAEKLPVGTAVFATDGAQIGEINRVVSEPSGAVTEIHVTTGGKAGLNADTVTIPVDKITSVGDGVKLSLSAEQAKDLPVVKPNAG